MSGKGVYVALSGAIAQENALDVVASNVANASSPGFQRLRPVFREALVTATKGDRDLRYGSLSRTALDGEPGAVRTTGRALDVALPPGVFLVCSTQRGERFTRAGGLTIDREGTLHAAGGTAAVESAAGGPIKATPGGGDVRIEPDGTVRQKGQALGRLKLVKVEKPSALVPEGSGLLAAGESGAATPSNEPISPESLEESNAQPVVAMTELMTATRTFEAFQKVLDQMDQVDRKLLTTVPNASE